MMKIVRGEEGYVGGETVLLRLVSSAMLLAAATIVARLLGLGVIGTVAVAVVVVVVVVAAAAEARHHRRRRRLVDIANVAAFADALDAEPVEGEALGSVRLATMDDVAALARLQWDGTAMVLAEGRRYRRYERFEPALRAWLDQALASDEGDVRVEVRDGAVVAWLALDKTAAVEPGSAGPPWPGPPPRRY